MDNLLIFNAIRVVSAICLIILAITSFAVERVRTNTMLRYIEGFFCGVVVMGLIADYIL